jgi:signal peptidase I
VKTCPVCGFHHEDRDTHCIRCKAPLEAEPTPEVEAFVRERASALERRSLRFFDFRGLVGAFLNRSGFKHLFTVDLPPDVFRRNPWKAATLSLIPGLGQLYNHQAKKALYMFIGWAIVLAAVIATWYQPFNHYILGVAVLWSAFAFHDGLKTAVLINGQYWRTRDSVAAYLAWIFEIGLFFILAQFISSMFFVKFRYMSENLPPVFAKGDRVAIDVFSYAFRHPRVGDIVYYDPKKVTMEHGSDRYVVDEFNKFERVVAGPGQTFEQRAGRFYLDGVEVGPEFAPLYTKEVPWDFKFTAPEGKYVVIFSHTGSEFWFVSSAPRLSDARVTHGWAEACLVSEEDIIGRAWFVYHPPPRKKFLTPKRLAAAKNPAS